MRYDFKPEHKTKVALFQHTGEAILFWVCLAALILLAFISYFRYTTLKPVVDAYQAMGRDLHPVRQRLIQVQAENDTLRHHAQELAQVQTERDSLRQIIERIESIESRMDSLHHPRPAPPRREPTIIDLK